MNWYELGLRFWFIYGRIGVGLKMICKKIGVYEIGFGFGLVWEELERFWYKVGNRVCFVCVGFCFVWIKVIWRDLSEDFFWILVWFGKY